MSLDFSLQAQHTPEDRHIAYAGLQGVSCCIRAKDNQMLEHITSFFISQRCTIHLPQHGSAYINIFQKTECVLLFGMVIQRNGIIDSPLLRRLRLNRWLQQKFEVGLDDAVETLCIQLQNFLRTILQRKVFCDCKINIQV